MVKLDVGAPDDLVKRAYKAAWDVLHNDKLLADPNRNDFIGRNNSTKSAWIDVAVRAALSALTEDDVEWVVNDIAELGVKIGSRFFFLYKDSSLEYKDELHDDGSPMFYRHVYKREFGECCHPWETIRRITGDARLPSDFVNAYGDPDDWKPMSDAPVNADRE
jgi:hypothetical protein